MTTTNGIRLFLIVSDRESGTSSVEDVGPDAELALARLRDKEAELAGSAREAVLLGSSSLETLKRTHSSYFGAASGLGSSLARGAA